MELGEGIDRIRDVCLAGAVVGWEDPSDEELRARGDSLVPGICCSSANNPRHVSPVAVDVCTSPRVVGAAYERASVDMVD